MATLAPSWQETTLEWIRQEHPHYLGARGTPAQKLTGALRKASYLLDEADHDKARHAVMLAAEVATWDQDAHQALRRWFDAGGYTAPSHIPAGGTDPKTGLPTVVIEGPNGPERISLDMGDEDAITKLEPAAGHGQTIEEIVAEEELRDDERYGSW